MKNTFEQVIAFKASDGTLHLTEADALMHSVALECTKAVNELAASMFFEHSKTHLDKQPVRNQHELAILIAKSLKDPQRREVWQMLIDMHNEGRIT